MRHFRIFPYPEEVELASLPGLPESLATERTKKNAATETTCGRRMDAAQDSKTQILGQIKTRVFKAVI